MITYILNCGIRDLTVTFNNQQLTFPARRGTNIPYDKKLTPKLYRWTEQREFSNTSNEPNIMRTEDRIPPSHMREIARNTPGLAYITDRTTMVEKWLKGLDARRTHVQHLYDVYMEGRRERMREDQQLVSENEDTHPDSESGMPYKAYYEYELKGLNSLEKQLKSNPPNMTDVLDAEAEPAVAIEQENIVLKSQVESYKELAEQQNTQLAQMKQQLAILESKVGVAANKRKPERARSLQTESDAADIHEDKLEVSLE
jgi:hypothetical protein